MMASLWQLTSHYQRIGDYEQAYYCARRQTELEPWDGAAHRQVMELLALRGQRSAALAHYEAYRQTLLEELGVEPIPETTELFNQIRRGEVVSADSQGQQVRAGSGQKHRERDASITAQHNLPFLPTPFVGREAELSRLVERIRDPQYRLISVVGPGGVGKTRLALAAAEEMITDFPQGVWFVHLAGGAETEKQQDTIARAAADVLGVPLPGRQSASAEVMDFLRGKYLLLVLDNIEHLVDQAAKFVTELLHRPPGVTILATSRERLNLQAEYVVRLVGLPVPTSAFEAGAGAYASIRLFVERAERTSGWFVLSGDKLQNSVRICRAVDGYPLGIELAAAWVEKMELDEIASLVERDLSSLVTTMRDVPRRHRSMRAVFEGSWEMLGEHGRSVLVALSIFSESFDRAGGMAVAKTDEAGLRSLEDKSLLYRDTDGRFSCHELIQQFAMERLEEYGPEFKAGVWRRYVRHYLWLVREKAGLLGAVDSHSVLGEVQIELANIQKAWRLAVSNADFDSIDRVIDDLAQLCRLMGLFRQGEAMFGEAVSQLRRQIEGKPSASAETHRRLGRLLINLAAFLNSQAKHKQAWMVAGTALGHFEEVDDPPNRAVANLQLGESLRARGELESAQEHAQRALGIARAHGLRQIEADGLLGLSDILLHRSGYAEAEMQAAQALAIYREIGHRRGEAMALNRLGDHAIRRGDCSQAWDCYERSRQVSRQIGDLVSEREGMLHLGIVLAGRGIYEDALVSFEQALPGFRESGWRLGECRALRQMGLVYLQLGHLDAARNCLEPALRISRGIKNREDEAALLSDFGWLAQREEQHDTARMYAEKAIEVCREIDHPGCERDALTFLGHALMALRQPKEAQWAFGEAMALQATVNPQLAPVEAMAGLAHALFADGRVDEAMGWVGKVLTHLERRPDMPETREPLWIYWAIYRVLKTCEDPRAERVLVDARILLNDRASRIADEQLRLSYLESRPYYLE